MTDKPLSIILGAQGWSFQSFIDQSVSIGGQLRYLSEMFYCFPMFDILVRNHFWLHVNNNHVRYQDKRKDRLDLAGRNPYIIGLAILSRVLRKDDRSKRRDTFPSWNRFRSYTWYGQVYNSRLAGKTVQDFGSSWTYPLGVADVPVTTSPFKSYNDQFYHHISFDDYCINCTRMREFVGQVINRTGSGGYSFGYATLRSIDIGSDKVDVVLDDVNFYSYPDKSHVNSQITLRVTRKSNGGLTVYVFGLEKSIINNDPDLGHPSYSYSDSSSLTEFTSPDYGYSLIGSLIKSFDMSISSFRPGLYHTQCQALAKVLLKYSSNFENFVESPELVELLQGLAAADNPFLSKVLSGTFAGRIASLAKLLSGAILLYKFALEPTYKAVVELAKGVVLPIRAESSMVFEEDSLSDLPETLGSLLSGPIITAGFSTSDVSYVKVTMRSTVTTSPDYNSFARALLESNAILRSGIVPSLEQVWAIAPFSFVVDWWAPISRYISDHSAYLSSPTLPFRVGHTVRVELKILTGGNYDLFFRSSESDYLSDPPGDSWLQSSGPPWVSIPLAVSLLIR